MNVPDKVGSVAVLVEITLDPGGKDETVSMVSTSILCIPGTQILRRTP